MTPIGGSDRWEQANFGRLSTSTSDEEAEYGWKKYRCRLNECVIELDLPARNRNKQIFKECPECETRTFMDLIQE